MKRILYSDWLPERARWAFLARSGLPALIPRMKKLSYNYVRNSWTMSAMETQKAAEESQTKKTETILVSLLCYKHSWLSFQAL